MDNPKLFPFLTFTFKAEEAMKFYAEILPGAEIKSLVRYGDDHPMAGEGEGEMVLHGELAYGGQGIMFMDMGTAHPAPDFTWASSLYIDCEDEAEFDEIFAAISPDGFVMMGPEPVAHIRKCTWVTDKFGVTWQLIWV